MYQCTCTCTWLLCTVLFTVEGLQHQHQKEVEDLKEMLSHNELLTTKLNQQLSETRGELKGQGELARQINEENSLLLEKLSRLGLADGEEDEARGREEASSPLSSIGKRCLGEQHEKVISSQQHALIDMRKKVNDLMTNKPPGTMSICTCTYMYIHIYVYSVSITCTCTCTSCHVPL